MERPYVSPDSPCAITGIITNDINSMQASLMVSLVVGDNRQQRLRIRSQVSCCQFNKSMNPTYIIAIHYRLNFTRNIPFLNISHASFLFQHNGYTFQCYIHPIFGVGVVYSKE